VSTARPVKVELSAVIVALQADEAQARPMVLTPAGPQGRDLPTAAFDPDRHRTLHEALADWVEGHTGLHLDYVEQLYTFGDPRRSSARDPDQPHLVSIGYLALVRPELAGRAADWSRRASTGPTRPSDRAWSRVRTITARGLASRCLRARSRDTAASSVASTARWNPPNPRSATIPPSPSKAAAASIAASLLAATRLPSVPSNQSVGPQAGHELVSEW